MHQHSGLLYLLDEQTLSSLLDTFSWLVIFFALKSTLSDINMTTLALCWLVWYMSFYPFTLKLFVFLIYGVFIVGNTFWCCFLFNLMNLAVTTIRFQLVNLLFVSYLSHPSLLPISSFSGFFWDNYFVWFNFYLFCLLISDNCFVKLNHERLL